MLNQLAEIKVYKQNIMKKNYLFAFLLMLIVSFSWGQTTTIDFESAGDGYTPSGTEGSGDTDVFNRSNPNLGGNSSYLWAVEDLSLSNPYIDLDQIDVTGAASFTFSIDMLTHHYNDWDDSDELLITYSVDGGAYQNLMWVQNTGEQYNDPVALDTDFDGDGECANVLPAITTGTGTDGCTVSSSSFETFSTSSISLSGNSSLDIKLQFNGLTAGDEGIYLDNIKINLTAASSNDTDSEVYDSGSQPSGTTFSSLLDTDAEKIEVFQMDIEDAGSGDGLDTKITNIRIKSHSTNTADWTDNIGGAELKIGVNDVTSTATITDTYIDFAISSGDLDITDGTSSTISAYVYLNNANVKDGAILSFMVDADDHGFTADASGSSFKNTLTLGDFNSNDFTIEVVSTEFQFSVQPSDVNVNNVMSPNVEVSSTDVNGNVDLTGSGSTRTVSLTTTGTFDGSATISVSSVSGVATFSNLIFSATGTGITITADDGDGGLSSVESNTFDVVDAGDGSMSNPYSCAELIALGSPGDHDKWITGYIVGYFTGTTSVDQTSPYGGDSNIALADDPNETDHNNMVPVQLSSGSDVRDAMGLQSIEENFGELVLLRGDLDTYFSHEGLKNTDDYKWNSDCTASTSGNWTSGSTWGHGKPGQHDDVIVQVSIALTMDESGECNDFTLKSDASGDASILGQGDLTVNGTATVERYISAYSGSSDGWHFLSSPVNSMTIAGSGFVSGTYDLYRWAENETADEKWYNYEGGSFGHTQFENGLGYLFADATGGVFEFTGTMNSSSYTKTLTYTASEGDGWNLIGNPYPSGLDWTALDKSAGNIGAAFYIVDPTDGSYNSSNGSIGDLIPANEIPANQGFFIQVSAASSIGIATADQVHTSNDFYKAEEVFEETLVVDLQGSSSSNKTYFQFRNDATKDFDFHADAYKLFGWADHAQIFSELEDVQYSINCLPYSEETITVPLGIYLQSDEELSLNFSGMETFFNTIKIELEDKQSGTTQNIRENSVYTFQASTQDNAKRFLLHFNGVTGVDDVEKVSDIQIYSVDNDIYINSLEDLSAEILVYTVNGQLIHRNQMNAESLKRISLGVSSGVYLVNVVTEETTTTQKVYVK